MNKKIKGKIAVTKQIEQNITNTIGKKDLIASITREILQEQKASFAKIGIPDRIQKKIVAIIVKSAVDKAFKNIHGLVIKKQIFVRILRFGTFKPVLVKNLKSGKIIKVRIHFRQSQPR